MPSITIRNVPVEVHNELAARASRSGRSLQEYMLAELARLASGPSAESLLSEVGERKRRDGVRLDGAEILADRDAERR